MTRRPPPARLPFIHSSPAKTLLAWSVLLAAGCGAAPPATTAPAGPQPQTLPTTTVTINGKALTLQVADDDAERETGLMYTTHMADDRGMVFVFPVERDLEFWMKNTPIDLDIVYVDHSGRVVSVKTMRAYDLSNVLSDGPATFAIELNVGVAAKLKIVAGQHIDLPADLTAHVR